MTLFMTRISKLNSDFYLTKVNCGPIKQVCDNPLENVADELFF